MASAASASVPARIGDLRRVARVGRPTPPLPDGSFIGPDDERCRRDTLADPPPMVAALAAALTLTACGGGTSDSADGGASQAATTTTLSLVGYAVPQPGFEKVIPGFQATNRRQGRRLHQSYGASGDQSRKVVQGLAADVVAFSVEPT